MTKDRWVPWVAYGGLILVGGMAIVVSGLWLTHLANLIGMQGPLAVSLPITVDAGGAVATILWLTGGTPQTRNWGRAVAIGAMAYSVAGNVLSHLIELRMLQVSWWLVVGVSMVYPVMCWLMVHLLVLSRSARAARKPKPQPKPEPKPETQEPKLHVVPANKREAGRKYFLNEVAHGRDPNSITPAEVDRAIGANSYSKKFIADWRADCAIPTQEEAR